MAGGNANVDRFTSDNEMMQKSRHVGTYWKIHTPEWPHHSCQVAASRTLSACLSQSRDSRLPMRQTKLLIYISLLFLNIGNLKRFWQS